MEVKDDVVKVNVAKHVVMYGVDGVYEGSCINNIPNGVGKFTWNEGDVYEGFFINGVPNGMGCMSWSNGDSCSGLFKSGIIEDSGKYYWKKENLLFEGHFNNGFPEAGVLKRKNKVYEGTFYFSISVFDSSSCIGRKSFAMMDFDGKCISCTLKYRKKYCFLVHQAIISLNKSHFI